MSEDTAPPASDPGPEEPLKLQGPLRRNAPMLLGVVVVLAVGPSLSRLLDTYRGVVLGHEEGRTVIAFQERPPRDISALDAQPGDIVQKERFAWTPVVVPRQAEDRPLYELHQRYNSSYEGIILRIDPPRVPSGPHSAIVQLQSGEKLSVPLHGTHLSSAQVGHRLRKLPGSWEPVLVPEALVVPPEATPGVVPAPEGAPTDG